MAHYVFDISNIFSKKWINLLKSLIILWLCSVHGAESPWKRTRPPRCSEQTLRCEWTHRFSLDFWWFTKQDPGIRKRKAKAFRVQSGQFWQRVFPRPIRTTCLSRRGAGPDLHRSRMRLLSLLFAPGLHSLNCLYLPWKLHSVLRINEHKFQIVKYIYFPVWHLLCARAKV